LKKLLYIYPEYLPYYDHINILGSNKNIISYINKNKLENFNYINLTYDYNNIYYQKFFPMDKKQLSKLINNLNPDYIITKEIFSPLSYIITKINKNYKHIIYCDETTYINKSLWGLFPISRYYAYYNIKNNKYYIASSELVFKRLVSLGIKSENILLINISVYPEKFKESKLINRDKFNLLFIGNLEKNKGIITIIKAFNIIKNRNIYLNIAGKGSLKDFVIKNSELNNNILYHGYINEEEKIKLLSESDVFLYPSEDILMPLNIKRWEEQGAVSALEAMASGLPVIGSDSGVLPEILGENLLIRQKDYLDLAKKIEFLYNNYDMRTKLHYYNIKRINENYNINKNQTKYCEFLDIVKN